MASISRMLQTTQHRPWQIPVHAWRYYQEWNRALFLHWKIPPEQLQSLIPESLTLDTFDGSGWISLVAFTMEKIRPRYLPALQPVSVFHELNVRTYVTCNGKAGVYFLSIEAQKTLSAFMARNISGLPYVKSVMSREEQRSISAYRSANPAKGFQLEAQFSTGAAVSQASPADQWLTERYCLYQEIREKMFRYDIHHLPWELQEVQLHQLELHYRIGSLDIPERTPDLLRYSPGVKVLAWGKVPV